MLQIRPFLFRQLSILIVLGLLCANLSLQAQQNKLLDSVRNIFRAQPDQALKLIDKVKEIAIKNNDHKSLIEVEVVRGNIFYFRGKHDESLKIYLAALVIAEKKKLPAQIASVCNEIGTLFKKNKDLDKSLMYYSRALNQAASIHDNAQIANALNNIGLIYEEKSDYPTALLHYQKSLLYYQKAKEKLGESYSLEYIGYVYGLMKKYDLAVINLKKSLALREALQDNYGIAICLIELTEVNRDKNDLKLAISYANQAIAFCKRINYPDMLQTGYQLLAQLYEKQNNFKKAYQAHKEYVLVKDSIFNATKSKQLNELQTKYETVQKEQKISLLSKENAIQQLKLTQRDGVIIIILIIFAVGLLIGFLLYNRYKLKQEARLQEEVINQQDLSTKAVLTAEENERKRIAGELHDGLGQMFSAVKLNLSSLIENIDFKNEHSKKIFKKTLNLVDESCNEVRVISHQMAPNVLLKAGLTTAIRDFISKIDSKKLKVNLTTFGLQERLDQNIEMVLYRVIQEAVNNVIKHAKADSLDIQLTKDEEGINAMIEDNGQGFEISQLDKFDGIGLKNIRTRVIYLKGTVDFSSNPGQGTLIAIFIPF